MKNKDIDNIMDQVTAGIRAEQVDSAIENDAAARVWTRVATEGALRMSAPRPQDAGAPSAGAPDAGAHEHIEGCPDFQSLIPAYVDGQLSEARSLLLVDHTHECIPCRRALKQERESRVAAPVRTAERKRFNYSLQPVVVRWGIAAVLVVGVGLLALPIVDRLLPFGSIEATVQAADGPVYAIANSQIRALKTGENLQRGEVLRTAKDAQAVVRLSDGSVIEMKDRSEFSIAESLRGTTVHLDRGSVIVEAAKQPARKHTVVGKLVKELKRLFGVQPAADFFVETGDSLVSVSGTTFAVNSGTKGSRVSVIEGEVSLASSGRDQILRPGQQATTNTSIEAVPVKSEVSWSRNAAHYTQVLDGLAALNKELNAVPRPGVRHSTELLDLMPEGTVLYAALPNLAATIAESHRIMQERIQQNPALREWFAKRQPGPGMDQAISAMREFGDQLGDEIAVGMTVDGNMNPGEPVVLAKLQNPSGFRSFFEDEVKKLGSAGKNEPNVRFVDDPAVATADQQGNGKAVYVWIHENVLAASPKLNQLQELSARLKSGSGFTSTPFHARIAGEYADGAGILVAADLERILALTKDTRMKDPNAGQREEAMSQLGIFNLKYFVFDQKDIEGGRTNTRAVLSFNETNHGVTSWLAAPSGMGSLEYISPDANVVAGFVVKNPSALVDDLLGALDRVCPDLRDHLNKLQTEHGLDVRKDFAAPLGGEYAFAIDGPILPIPSWKLIFEVNDPARLQQTLERVAEEINKEAIKDGKNGLAWERSDENGHTFYSLRSKDFGFEVNYTFANGYMIVGPTRALVARALVYHDSGTTLLRSAKFMAGLPADGNANFSALVYHNLEPLVRPFAGQIERSARSMPEPQQKAITALAANMQPTLFYAYAFNDRIEFAANTDGGPFGLSPAMLLGMPNAFELEHIMGQGLHPKSEK